MSALPVAGAPLGAGAGDAEGWAACRFASASILPVASACDLSCPFCFSRSSISALPRERTELEALDLEGYFERARARGATRLVITGGGEPLLRPDLAVALVTRGRRFFDEITCFTNGSHLTRALAERLAEAGLTYLCWSRHEREDEDNRALMGPRAPAMEPFFAAAAPLRVRAVCVLATGSVDSAEKVWAYVDRLSAFGVREFTFKHTYVAYAGSLFRGSGADRWALAHQIQEDPLGGAGQALLTLPWGPVVRRYGQHQLCYYWEPTPEWEKEHRLCRSANLLADGRVYASLEDERSLLYTLGR